MAEISLLKYIQWRPIGVCDSGEGKQRKAKIFSKVDLESVTSSEIGRGNWRKNPKVMKIILNYASDVGKISNLTNGMTNPEVSDIKLVGAVLEHYQTPNLNKESIEGKVQLFQVSFKESKIKKTSNNTLKSFLKWLGIIFIIVFTIVFVFFLIKSFSGFSIKKNHIPLLRCGYNRGSVSYLDELINIRKSLLMELNRLPEWLILKDARLQCTGNVIGVDNQEKILLGCFLTIRSRTENMELPSSPNLKKINACAITLCQRNLNHLSSFCKRL